MLRRLLPATKLVARRWKSGASPVAAYAAEDVVKSDHCDVIDGGPVGPYRLRRPLKLPKDHRGVEVIRCNARRPGLGQKLRHRITCPRMCAGEIIRSGGQAA